MVAKYEVLLKRWIELETLVQKDPHAPSPLVGLTESTQFYLNELANEIHACLKIK